MRLIMRICVGLGVLTALAQAWVTYDWIGGSDNHCDYPEACLATWLPRAFSLAEYLWMATVCVGVVALAVAGLLKRSVPDILAVGSALALAFVSYAMTPMVQTTPGKPITDRRPIEADPFFWGGHGYTVAALLMAVSAVIFGWQFVRSSRPPAQSTAPTMEYQSAPPPI